jgi:undecaprenyl pyrophosphate phosphatase UppP
VALKVLLHLVNRGRLHLFAPYCWIIGIVTVIVGL